MKRISGRSWQIPRAIVPIVFAFLLASQNASNGQPASDLPGLSPQFSSIRELMVGLVNPAANRIWNAGSAEKLSPDDWVRLKQAARDLTRSVSAIADKSTMDERHTSTGMAAWRIWTDDYSRVVAATNRATDNEDLLALASAGDRLVSTCEQCHRAYAAVLP